MPFFSNKVPADYEKSERLDKYIASLPNGMNRSKLKSGVTEILINGKKVSIKPSLPIKDKNIAKRYSRSNEDITYKAMKLKAFTKSKCWGSD